MRYLRLGVSLLFVVVAVVFGVVFISEKIAEDKTVPVITIDSEILDVSLKADEAELLRGVTAYDEKDKDITDKIIVESISKFIDKGVCRVTYAVCDSDNHVAKATRKIRYSEYTSPKFKMAESTCYSLYENINLLEAIQAWDCLDGNISGNLIITSENYSATVAGVYTLDVTATNKNGDTSVIKLPLIIEDRSLDAPKIELTEYLVYVEPGAEKPDFKKYIEGATDAFEEEIRKDSIRVETNLNTAEEGVYTVHYYVTDDRGIQGHTVLIAVVDGND